MDTSERAARINELARKKRTGELSDGELNELMALRADYLRDFRLGMEQLLESIRVEQPDGSIAPLHKKDVQ